jgi:membrane protease YdiL (CAAX protease family)
MKQTPRPVLGIVAYLVYIGLVFGVGLLMGIDYDQIAASSENLLKWVIIPVAVGCVGIVVITSWLGWWQPALNDRAPSKHRWPIIAPLLMIAIIVLQLINTDFGELIGTWILFAAIGTLLVGFGEELTTRGVLLVGFRGKFGEVWVWFLTSLLFGLMHSLNFFGGQELVPTLGQMGFAFLSGTVLYITRRLAGMLVWAMVLHALWDFSTLAGVQAGDIPAIVNVLAIGMYLIALISVAWVIRDSDERLDGGAAPPHSSVRR